MAKPWSMEEIKTLHKLAKELDGEKNKWEKISHAINVEYGTNRTPGGSQEKHRTSRKFDIARVTEDQSNPLENYKNNKIRDWLADGQIRTTVDLTEEDYEKATMSPHDVLLAAGYNPSRFKLVNTETTTWDMPSKEDGITTMYRMKVRAKPRDPFIEWEQVFADIEKRTKPVPARTVKESDFPSTDRYLVFNMFDLHFGNNNLEDYEEQLAKAKKIMTSDPSKEILLLSGGDILNEDNYSGTTTSGTEIGKTDMTQAWLDAAELFTLMIEFALDHAEKVTFVYVPGNHDGFSGHTVALHLKNKYKLEPRLTMDTDWEVFKAGLLGHNFIGITHGHKSRYKKYSGIFATRFAHLWGAQGVYTRDCYTGHFHHQWTSSDEDGLFIIQNPTRNKLDRYHIDNGFVTAHQRFIVGEYNEFEKTSDIYI